MPSPFPGMDPYLEAPNLWPDVHNSLIVAAREFLLSHLDPRYYVRIEERVYISELDDPGREVIIPDLRIGQRRKKQRHTRNAAPASGLQIAEPLVVATQIDDEIHESRLEILDRTDRSVVTVIEVVSPTNKVSGSRGRESYRSKRAEVLASPSHWVEIDLLRSGVRFIPRQILSQGDYFVYLSRAKERPKAYVWPIHLSEHLPVIAIPLKAGDADAPLALQKVLDIAYDRAGYERVIDYDRPPEVRLSKKQATWANDLLRKQGFR